MASMEEAESSNATTDDTLASELSATGSSIVASSDTTVVPSAEESASDRPSPTGNSQANAASRSSLRKRSLRARRQSSSSSSHSSAEHIPEAPPQDRNIEMVDSDLIDTSSDSSDSDDALHDLPSDTMSSDDHPRGTNDPSLAWTEKLCNPVNTHNFRSVKWLNRRAIGSRPNVVDSCWRPRMEIQGSPWMIGRWKMHGRLESHEGCVNAVNFNESGSLIASGSDDLNVIVWDWARRRVVSRFDSGHSANVFQSKFLPFSSDLHIVSCARDGQVRLAQLSTSGECRNTRRLGMHRGSAHKLSLDVGCPHAFYSCGEDAAVFLFDVRESQPTKLFVTKERQSKIALYSIHGNPCNDYEFLTSGRDAFIRVYDRRYCTAPSSSGSDRPAKKFCPPHLNRDNSGSKHVTCAVYSNDGRQLIGSYNDDDIYLFDVSQNDGTDAIQKFRGHRNYATVKGVNFYGPHSEFVVSGSDCGNVFVWEKESASIVNMFQADEGGVVNVLEPHPHDPVLATSGLDHDIKIWSPDLEYPLTTDDLSEKVTKCARRNAENRKSALSDDADGPLPSIAWILMEALQRERRRHLRAHLAAREEDAESSSEDDDDDDDDDDDTSDNNDENGDGEHEGDDGGSGGHGRHGRQAYRIQCAQS